MNVSLRIDHTAIVVRDLDTALDRYRALLGTPIVEPIVVEEQRVRVAFLPLGDTNLELVEPTDSYTGVARFLERHGEGMHHVGVGVADIHGEIERLMKEGVRLIDRSPRQGPHGLIAFVHPSASGGVLIELVQNDT